MSTQPARNSSKMNPAEGDETMRDPSPLPSSSSSSSSTLQVKAACTSAATASLEKPKRPLSAYNLFFQEERRRLLAERPVRPEGIPIRRGGGHGKVGFAELAKTVAAKWKVVHPQSKKRFELLVQEEKMLYHQKLALWNEESTKNPTLKTATPASMNKNQKGTRSATTSTTMKSNRSNQVQQKEPQETEVSSAMPSTSNSSDDRGSEREFDLQGLSFPSDLRSCCSSPLFDEEEQQEVQQDDMMITTSGSAPSTKNQIVQDNGCSPIQTPHVTLGPTVLHRLVSPQTEEGASRSTISSSSYCRSSSSPTSDDRPRKRSAKVSSSSSNSSNSSSASSPSFSIDYEPSSPTSFDNDYEPSSHTSFDNERAYDERHAFSGAQPSSSLSPSILFPSSLRPPLNNDNDHSTGISLAMRPAPRRPEGAAAGTSVLVAAATNTGGNQNGLVAERGCTAVAHGSANPLWRRRPLLLPPPCAAVLPTPLDQLKRSLDDESLEFFVDLFRHPASGQQ
ncbi:hypothetical protein ACA910_008026 [Epithemia clementina (nom. ined.)]